MNDYILVLYYSRHGSTHAMANHIARGIDAEDGPSALLRTVPNISAVTEQVDVAVPSDGPPYVTLEELKHCQGLVLGSPTRFGNMAAPLKYFFDQTSSLWLAGDLNGKPAALFTSSASMHGGNESTLLSMLLPLMHHGMLIMSLPYTNTPLMKTTTGGTPYGASHVSFMEDNRPISQDETELCTILGREISRLCQRLA